jgi:hypothetical protein
MAKNVETEKRGMMKSHAERMCEASIDYPKTLCQDYEVRGVEEVVENGRIVKKSTIVTVHPQDKFKGFKASDFALENVIAAGALDSLKEGKLGANTLSELSDSMEGTIDNVISAVDAAESQNVEPQNND